MTGSTNRQRVPGAILSSIARLMFDEPVRSTIVEPAIWDLQYEVALASPSRIARWRALARGYAAFWRVTLMALLTSNPFSTADTRSAGFFEPVKRIGAGPIVLALTAISGLVFGRWMAAVTAAAALFATVVHVWNERHPSEVATPDEPVVRRPQINFSSTDVAGNAGGLIFALGTVFIVAVALPSVLWFLCGATVAGCVIAWALVTWHTNHPNSLESRITWR